MEEAGKPDLEWLAVAQHHGLPTRMLDWTYNPLVAVYFAARSEDKCNGALYCFTTSSREDFVRSDDPAWTLENLIKRDDASTVKVYRPPHISDRIRAQQALFTVQVDPWGDPLDPWQPIRKSGKVTKVELSLSKQVLRKNLSILGIGSASMFPGLEGVSENLISRYCVRRQLPDPPGKGQAPAP